MRRLESRRVRSRANGAVAAVLGWLLLARTRSPAASNLEVIVETLSYASWPRYLRRDSMVGTPEDAGCKQGKKNIKDVLD